MLLNRKINEVKCDFDWLNIHGVVDVFVLPKLFKFTFLFFFFFFNFKVASKLEEEEKKKAS